MSPAKRRSSANGLAGGILGTMGKHRRFRAVDLFAGAGGLTLSAQACDADVVFAVENDKHAAATYRQNFCNSEVHNAPTLYDESILNLDAQRLASEHFGGEAECDILLGGPPCQGFSAHRIKDAGVNDPRNHLIYRYFDFISALRPRAFLMENVPGILWPRHKGFLDEFYRLANSLGYSVREPTIVDARDFGVPQRRKRVFIVGFRDTEVQFSVWPPRATHGPFGNRDNLPEWNNCAEVFRPAPLGDTNDIHMRHGPELIEVFRKTPANGGSRRDSGRVLPCHESHNGHKDVYGRIDPNAPAPTMTTACINPSKGRFVHPTRHHGITVRQAARIQDFPDHFRFSGGLMAAGKQIGNAVPKTLGAVLINAILAGLNDTAVATHELKASA
jgi:DNA (cytosine-5)-methyltransferase 1